jgi:hypothetical protein
MFAIRCNQYTSGVEVIRFSEHAPIGTIGILLRILLAIIASGPRVKIVSFPLVVPLAQVALGARRLR